MTEDDLFETIKAQAEEGVDFMTVHCGLTLKAVDRLKKQGRMADIVSVECFSSQPGCFTIRKKIPYMLILTAC